jgi:hypothetical protein
MVHQSKGELRFFDKIGLMLKTCHGLVFEDPRCGRKRPLAIDIKVEPLPLFKGFEILLAFSVPGTHNKEGVRYFKVIEARAFVSRRLLPESSA